MYVYESVYGEHTCLCDRRDLTAGGKSQREVKVKLKLDDGEGEQRMLKYCRLLAGPSTHALQRLTSGAAPRLTIHTCVKQQVSVTHDRLTRMCGARPREIYSWKRGFTERETFE